MLAQFSCELCRRCELEPKSFSQLDIDLITDQVPNELKCPGLNSKSFCERSQIFVDAVALGRETVFGPASLRGASSKTKAMSAASKKRINKVLLVHLKSHLAFKMWPQFVTVQPEGQRQIVAIADIVQTTNGLIIF